VEWSGLVLWDRDCSSLIRAAADGPAEETASWERTGIPQGTLSDRTLRALRVRQEAPHERKYHSSRLLI